MKNRIISIIALFVIITSSLRSQDYELWQKTKFTWEGAKLGNKAIWKADDTLNYYTLEGTTVKVKMHDPHHLNTTTTNQSEFNDYTKTNTFYGAGNLAMQMKTSQATLSLCLEFEFSNPVVMRKFTVFDIDMIQNSNIPATTFLDSIHFSAFNMNGEVPLDLNYLSSSPAYTIENQSAKAHFIAGFNGDLRHTDPNGGIVVSSLVPITKFILCHANSADDDGISNSQAIKILGFEYQDALGSISGKVLDFNTGLPIAHSVIKLVDINTGFQAYNKLGELMEVTTNTDGYYEFLHLPLGSYRIIQTNASGYNSHNDIDGINDDTIHTEININHAVSSENNFFDVLQSPLPVTISDITLYNHDDNLYKLSWKVEQEINCDFYEVEISTDGKAYDLLGRVMGQNKPQWEYAFDFKYDSTIPSYVRLSQTDFDGIYNILGIKILRPNSKSDLFEFYPNPLQDHGNLIFNDINKQFDSYAVYNILGNRVQSSPIPLDLKYYNFNLSNLSRGIYYLQLNGIEDHKTIKIIKR